MAHPLHSTSRLITPLDPLGSPQVGVLATSSPFYSQHSSREPLPHPPSPCSSVSSMRPRLDPSRVGGGSFSRPELPVDLSVCVSIVILYPLAPGIRGLRCAQPVVSFWHRAGVCWVPVWAEPRGGESVRGSSVQTVRWGSWDPSLPACGSQASPRGSR